MSEPPLSTPPVNPGETLCIKPWTKTKSLTFNRLSIFLGGIQNVLKIVDRNLIIPDVPHSIVKEGVALSLNLYAIRYLSDNVKATCRTLHPDLKEVKAWVMAQRFLFLKKQAAENTCWPNSHL